MTDEHRDFQQKLDEILKKSRKSGKKPVTRAEFDALATVLGMQVNTLALAQMAWEDFWVKKGFLQPGELQKLMEEAGQKQKKDSDGS